MLLTNTDNIENKRTCVTCRKADDKHNLIRFIRSLDGEVFFDEKNSFACRGSWICPKKNCLIKAFEKNLLFKGQPIIKVDCEKMITFIESRIRLQILSMLGLLRKMGELEIGRDQVLQISNSSKIQVVVFSSDLSKRSLDGISLGLKKVGIYFLNTPFSMAEIGKSIGRKPTGVVGLHKCRITKEILLKLKILSKMKQ